MEIISGLLLYKMQEKMDFRNDWMHMLDAYYKLEKQFIHITDIIPVDNNQNTHSPVLYSILQTACGQIENMLRLLCDKFDLEYAKQKFPVLYKTLNITGILEQQWVYYSKTGNAHRPFINESPFWWQGYNESKHDLPNGFRQGNLQNVLFSMCGLFCLHNISHYANYASKKFFCNKYWRQEYAISTNYTNQAYVEQYDERPRSELFYCFNRYNEEGAAV